MILHSSRLFPHSDIIYIYIYIYIELNCLFKHQYSWCPLWCIIITKNNKNKRIEKTK